MSEYGDEGQEPEREQTGEYNEKEEEWDITDEKEKEKEQDRDKNWDVTDEKEEYSLDHLHFKEYINLIIGKYKKSIYLNQKQLKLSINQNYINLKNSRMVNTYVNRNLYDHFGIIYRIIDKKTGKLLYGFTLDSLDYRWMNYKRFALKHKYSNHLLPIEKEIIKIYDAGLNPDDNFIIKHIDVCFDYNTLRKREDYWINRHNTTDPKKGYNTYKGGGGGPKVKLPMHIVAEYIAEGYKSTEITDLLLREHNIQIGHKTITRRINEYWDNRLNAQKIFLRPVLERIIQNGYSSREIVKVFGSRGRNIIDRLIPKLFDKKSFSDLRKTSLIKTVEKLIIKGYGQKEMAEKLPGFGETEIDNRIKEKWGSLREAREVLWRPVIIERLIANWKPKDIFFSLGYSESTATSKHNEIMSRLFNGMNSEQTRKFYLNKIKDRTSI